MTAPDPEVSSLAGGEWDVSSLFEPRQLRGRQVSWEAVRQALAELGRPSTLVELRETIWRQYSDYITRVGLGEVRRSDKFGSLVEKIVSSSVVGGRVVLARVGPDSQQEEFLWLERAEWPAVREREAWSDYRTVHQASTEISGYFLVILQPGRQVRHPGDHQGRPEVQRGLRPGEAGPRVCGEKHQL